MMNCYREKILTSSYLKFRLRTVVGIIAIIAVSLGLYDLNERASHYRGKATFHHYQSDRYFRQHRFWDLQSRAERLLGCRDSTIHRSEILAKQMFDLATYHHHMENKYLHATSHPWKTVLPDPPTPLDPFPFTGASEQRGQEPLLR
jgi:hypothetical protein